MVRTNDKTPVYSVADVIDVLCMYKNSDKAVMFASDLTGLSADALAEAVWKREKDKALLALCKVGQKFTDNIFNAEWICTEADERHAVLQNRPPVGAKVEIGGNTYGILEFTPIPTEEQE